MIAALLWSVALMAAPVPATSELDDAPEVLKPKVGKTEAEQNQIEALSLFAAARTEESRGNFNKALRLYQRALRHDPQALSILKQIIEVAQQLDRMPEAVRYAQRAVQMETSDPRLVISLAEQLTEQNDFEGALKLYEIARSQPQLNRKSAVYLTLTLQVGRLRFLTGDMAKSADAFAIVLDGLEHPDEYGLTPEALKLLGGRDERSFELFGEALLGAGRDEVAEKAFEKAKSRASNKELYAPIYSYHQAQLQAHRKQFDAALKSLDEYFDAKETRQDEAPYQLLGTILDGLKKKDQVVDRLAKLAADNTSNLPLHQHLAKLYVEAKNWPAAEKTYRHLLSTSAAPQANRGLIHVYREEKRWDDVLATLAAAIDKAGVESVAREAKSLAENKEQLDALLAASAKIEKKSPSDLPQGARVALAMMLLEAKRFDESGKYFKLALATQPKNAAELLFSWGLGLLNADQHAAAAEVFERGLNDKALPNDNPLFHTYLALSLEMAGKTEEALKVARSAAQMAGGKNARLESRVCWILYHAKRYSDGREAYEKLLTRFDSDFSNEDTRRVMREARLSLSNIHVIQGDLAKAEEYLEQVLDEYPEDTSAMNDLGYLWADQNKHLERALEMIQKAVEADPDNEAYRDSLGWAFYRLGRYEEALAELEKAAKVDDPDGVILDHLADCLNAMKRQDQARATWKRALEKLKKDGDTSKIDAVEKKLKS